MLNVRDQLIVPEDVRYISDWEGFCLPEEPTIIDKTLPGCGFTQWCIDNGNSGYNSRNVNRCNVILCSPRKILLENKSEQFPEALLIRNELDKDLRVDLDLTATVKAPKKKEKTEAELKIEEDKRKQSIIELNDKIDQYRTYCQIKNIPMKILVTYDSYRLVKSKLINLGIFDSFYTVVDEFQSIFVDSSFKSETEMEFMNTLKDVRRLCFVSATPMMKEYLDMLEEFDNIPYYEMNWSKLNNLRIVHPVLDVKPFKSLTSSVKKIVDSYLEGKFKVLPLFNEEGNLVRMVTSKEAVFYVNSVKNILGMIKACNLTPDQVNILCADCEENRKKIRSSLGKEYSVGKVPLKGESNKMFTFCTRTVYLGADFHSDNARSFIFSDANMKTLKVDISLDLPQIIGRQRNTENPWHNRAEFYYKSTADYKKMTREEFVNRIQFKVHNSENLLKVYEDSDVDAKKSLILNFQKVAKSYHYDDDYVAVNKHAGNHPLPVFNNLVMVSEMRAFEIQQIDYANRINIFSSIENAFTKYDGPIINTESKVEEIIRLANEVPTVSKRLKYVIEKKSELTPEEFNYVLTGLDELSLYYIAMLGPNGCKSCGYNIFDMKKEIEKSMFDKSKLLIYISGNFKIGEKLSLSTIKTRLSSIYVCAGYSAVPRAIDIKNYFEIKDVMFTELQSDGTKKRVHGYELISKKF